jgi:hypothetical protein
MREMQPVPVELVLAANQAIHDVHGSGADTLLTISHALLGKCSTWEIVSVHMRLDALTRAFKGAPSNEFVINAHGRDYKIMNEVLFHAAAKVPMTYIETEDEYVFDQAELMKIARELWEQA